jgi:6-pyruvoyltetrahydropterin/6-carboxytetrahydropterin synthase
VSAIAYSTRRFTFAAGHHYRVDAWSSEENERVFGRLTIPHGHNYVLEVTVRGPIDPATGMVINLTELKAIVHDAVVERFDHADLNADALFRGRVPTTENIAIVIWNLLVGKLGAERLSRVRVWEDDTLYVDYRGAEADA